MRHRSIAELIPSFDLANPIFLDEETDAGAEIAAIELPSFLPKTPREPVVDVEEVFEAGRQSGLADVEQQVQFTLEEARIDAQSRLDAARRVWVAAEAEALTALTRQAVLDVEARICERIGHLLLPFLDERLRALAVNSLREQIAPLLMGDDAPVIRVGGAPDLMAALADELGDHPRLIYASSTGTEASAIIGESTIDTRIGEWVQRLNTACTADAGADAMSNVVSTADLDKK